MMSQEVFALASLVLFGFMAVADWFDKMDERTAAHARAEAI